MKNYFKARREQMDLTQKVVADRLGLTVQAVSSWERGKSPPDASLWDELAEVYGDPVTRISSEVLNMIRVRRKAKRSTVAA